jgi:DNA helicase HerA-like ATPase
MHIGMVLGTEDATPLEFWFAVKAGVKVQLDDVVMVEVPDPAETNTVIRVYGIVDALRRRYEGVQFDGDTELVAAGLMPASVAYAAHVLVTRVEPEEFIPPAPGDLVALAEGEALSKALYLDNMEAPLPAGILRSGEPGYINFEFVNGQKGAHINISGISGVATKTSYALFLLYSMFHAKVRGADKPLIDNVNATKAIIFNVKGEDLLFLDKPNQHFAAEESKWQQKRRSQESRYACCGLPEGPFPSVALYAPAQEGANLVPDVQQRSEGVAPYLWTLHDFCLGRMLPFVLTERDAMTNLGFLVGHLEEKLCKLAQSQRGPDLEVEAGDEGFKLEDDAPFGTPIESGIDFETLSARTGRTRLKRFDELVSYLEWKLLTKGTSDDERAGGDPLWTANQAKATREALIRRLRGASKHLRRLVRGDLPAKAFGRARLDILASSKQVHVIDLHTLAPLAQMFVVGVLLRQVFEEREARARGKTFVVLDELNKYAPAEGDSPIKDVLLDIAERGRSLGIILIGAQQTASQVERRIVSNAAVRVVGRLDAAEAERAEYRFMPRSFLGRSTILAPGTMIVHQPDVPTPMMLTFPFPSWATRGKEVAQTVSDDEALDVLG